MNRKAIASLLTLAVSLGGVAVVSATVPMQKKAKEAGLPATSCLYCHGEKIPKKGAVTYNDRGKWLQAEKDKRKAKEVDAAWLKDYKEPAK
jgi:cytochrome c553